MKLNQRIYDDPELRELWGDTSAAPLSEKLQSLDGEEIRAPERLKRELIGLSDSNISSVTGWHFFSLPSLRYAVPAFAAIAICVITAVRYGPTARVTLSESETLAVLEESAEDLDLLFLDDPTDVLSTEVV